MLYISEQARQNFPLLYNNKTQRLTLGRVATSRRPFQEKRQFNNLRIVNCVWGGGGGGLRSAP